MFNEPAASPLLSISAPCVLHRALRRRWRRVGFRVGVAWMGTGGVPWERRRRESRRRGGHSHIAKIVGRWLGAVEAETPNPAWPGYARAGI